MSTNHIKIGASTISSISLGDFSMGVSGGADYGPTSETGFYNGIVPPVGGYTIYVSKPSQGPSIHVPRSNNECLYYLNKYGANTDNIGDALTWASTQTNLLVRTSEYVIGDIPVPYTIGQSALGGIVTYINGGGSTGTSGFISALTDQSVSAYWGCNGNEILGAYGTAIGTGAANTAAILANCVETPIAASVTQGTINGFSDWYLPSVDELNAMYNNIGPGASYPNQNIGNFNNGAYYWTSTETNANAAANQYFGDGTQSINTKNSNYGRVRAIRSF